jgi:phosphate transport system permease protein
VRSQVLPAALPGVLTGTILALSRAIGEAAPMILVGAAAFIATDPSGLSSSFTVLPIQIFNWTSQPRPEFREIAAAGIIVLIALLLVLNLAAILLRNKFTRKW